MTARRHYAFENLWLYGDQRDCQFFFILLKHKGFPTQLDIFGRFSAKGCLGHRFDVTQANIAQLLAQHRFKYKYPYSPANQM